jgi:hypothetical protein
MIPTRTEQGKIDKDTFGKIYGDEAFESDYNFKRLILETTPQNITIFTESRTAVSRGVLVMVKAMCVGGAQTLGYSLFRERRSKDFNMGFHRISRND